MSLIVLRYPELIELMHGIGAQLRTQSRGAGGRASDTRSQYLILEGRLDATAKGIESDFAEAVAAGGAPVKVKAALTPDQQKLAARHRSVLAGGAHIHRPRAGHYGNGRTR
jgi:hypothetical protein